VVQDADAATALASGILDAAEQERAAKFRRSQDRRSYVAAHVALRSLLGARLGMPPEAVEFVRETCPTCGGPHGRPAVAGGGLHFSLSHSGDLAMIGLAATTIGVDVEKTPTLRTATETARMLHPDETAELQALGDDARAEAFGRAWVRKEAYLKALGTGLSRALSLDYMGTGPAPAQAQPGWTLADVRAPRGYLAATATRGGPH
jgi:4'-phosphopantetheinyl transferase